MITPLLSFMFNILGDRTDFVLTADQPVGNYWMRAYCESIKTNVLAVVRYEGAANELPPEPEGAIAGSGIVSFELKSFKKIASQSETLTVSIATIEEQPNFTKRETKFSRKSVRM